MELEDEVDKVSHWTLKIFSKVKKFFPGKLRPRRVYEYPYRKLIIVYNF